MKHSNDCLCDTCLKIDSWKNEYESIFIPIEKPIDPRTANLDKATELMDLLGIPQHGDTWSSWAEVYAVDLYDIFMDKEKLRVLVAKLRNKAFW